MLIYCLTLLCTTLNSVITGLFCCFTLSGRHKIRFLLFFSLFVPVLLVALDWADIAEIAEGHPLRTIIALIENILLLHFFFEDSLVKKLLIFAAGAVLQYLSVFLVAFPLAILDFFDPILVDVALTPEFLVTQYLGMICYFFLMLVTTRFIRNRSAEGNEGWNLLILFMIVQLFLFFTFPVGMGKVIPQEFLVFLSLRLCYAFVRIWRSSTLSTVLIKRQHWKLPLNSTKPSCPCSFHSTRIFPLMGKTCGRQSRIWSNPFPRHSSL